MINYNYLFDLTPISHQETLICSDWLEDHNRENLAYCLRNNYDCIDYRKIYEKINEFDIFRYKYLKCYQLNNFEIINNNDYISIMIINGRGFGYGNRIGCGNGYGYGTGHRHLLKLKVKDFISN